MNNTAALMRDLINQMSRRSDADPPRIMYCGLDFLVQMWYYQTGMELTPEEVHARAMANPKTTYLGEGMYQLYGEILPGDRTDLEPC